MIWSCFLCIAMIVLRKNHGKRVILALLTEKVVDMRMNRQIRFYRWEKKNENEDKKVCYFKLSCVLVHGSWHMRNSKYGISLFADSNAYTVKCVRVGTDDSSFGRI
jgi:hypothetical protein